MNATTQATGKKLPSAFKLGAAAGAAGAAGLAYAYLARARAGQGTPDRSDDTARPSWGKLLVEFPAAARLMAAQAAPSAVVDPSVGQGRPVIVFPGFLAHDWVTLRLRRTLAACGFRPFGWANGVNLGFRPDLFDRLEARLDEVIEEAGGPVVLVGWSLGGLYARELAKRRPADVSMVVTRGTPFSRNLRDNNAWKLYETLNDHPVDDAPIEVDLEKKPPVPTVAIWSTGDGIVAPASASGRPAESDEQRRVSCKHNELVSNPEALKALVDVLDRP